MAAGRHLRLRLAKPESRWLMVEKNRTPEPIESGEIEAFRQETEERTVVCFTLHKHLMEILRYLGAWGEVGLDADDKLSATMALYQLRILADESHEAADCLIQLPQTEFVIVLRTAITMILQNLDIAKTQADNVIADGSDDEAVIRYAREAVRESHAELAGPLKRMAAFLLTHELTADIRAKTQWIEEKLDKANAPRATEEWSRPMPKVEIATIMKLGSAYKLTQFAISGVYKLREAGSRQSFQICLSGLPEEIRKKLI